MSQSILDDAEIELPCPKCSGKIRRPLPGFNHDLRALVVFALLGLALSLAACGPDHRESTTSSSGTAESQPEIGAEYESLLEEVQQIKDGFEDGRVAIEPRTPGSAENDRAQVERELRLLEESLRGPQITAFLNEGAGGEEIARAVLEWTGIADIRVMSGAEAAERLRKELQKSHPEATFDFDESALQYSIDIWLDDPDAAAQVAAELDAMPDVQETRMTGSVASWVADLQSRVHPVDATPAASGS